MCRRCWNTNTELIVVGRYTYGRRCTHQPMQLRLFEL